MTLPPGDSGRSLVVDQTSTVVVRAPRMPALAGRYLYGDYCGGKIEGAAVDKGRVVASDDLGLVVPELSSFGVDGSGRIYGCRSGTIDRLDPKPADESASGARAQLRDPGGNPEPDPDRGQKHVEDHVSEDEQPPPQSQPRQRHPALRAQIPLASGRRAPRNGKRRLARRPVWARRALVAGAHRMPAWRCRRSTNRMIRIAVSSTESSVTSITGQPRRRCTAAASSSSR